MDARGMGDGIVLAIEVSNPSAAGSGHAPGVALGRVFGGAFELLGVESLRGQTRHDDDLMPAIDRLTRAGGVRPVEIRRYAVSVGPGGFTGLRVATVAAKMLAMAHRAECAAVPSALVAIETAGVGEGERTMVALASKGATTHATVFVGREPEGPGRIVRADDIAALAPDRVIADGSLPEAIAAACAAVGARREALALDPGVCCQLGALAEAVEPASLGPIYPREPEAVRKWRERHRGQAG